MAQNFHLYFPNLLYPFLNLFFPRVQLPFSFNILQRLSITFRIKFNYMAYQALLYLAPVPYKFYLISLPQVTPSFFPVPQTSCAHSHTMAMASACPLDSHSTPLYGGSFWFFCSQFKCRLLRGVVPAWPIPIISPCFIFRIAFLTIL